MIFWFSFHFFPSNSFYIDSRLNGLNVNTSKTRPRIPTPDVSKESLDKDNANGNCKNLTFIPIIYQKA